MSYDQTHDKPSAVVLVVEIAEHSESCRGRERERKRSSKSRGLELEIGVLKLEEYDDTRRWVDC